MSKKNDLPIRETILGVIKSKDLDGTGIIHSSDFKNAIRDLGFPPGSTIIENILVHCKLEANGNIDYSTLERELIRERRVFNADLINQPSKPTSTSSGTTPRPWRTDLVHQQKVNSERQSKLVHEHRTQVHEIYNLLSHHDINSQDAIFHLGKLEIFPTKEFIKVLDIMNLSEVSFAQFIRSLTQYDPNSSTLLEDKEISAGGSRKAVHVDDSMGTQRKRSGQANQMTLFGDRNTDKFRPYRKTVNADNNSISDQTIFKTNRIKEAIFSDSSNVPLLSHAQHDMLNGAFNNNKSTGEDIELTFNSEQRLQREQVFAAIRKLHSGELSMEDFQDKLFNMGFDLPETIAAELRRAVASGMLDQRKFVKLLDATVFRDAALEECKNANIAKQLQLQFIQSVRSKGMSSIIELGQLFRRFDLDGDGLLSFSEFRKGINEFGLIDSRQGALGDNELKMLFNSFDKNGDGVLDSTEFLNTIRGELNAKRLKVVRQAFMKLNRYAQDTVPLDEVVEQYNVSQHPEVQNGEKTEREVANEFVLWFSNAPNFTGSISGADFEEYFASVSSFILNDGVFEQMIKALWGLDDKSPPPPEYHQRHGPPVPPPAAKQSHGDLLSWTQQQSRLEVNENAVDHRKRVISGFENKNLHTNVIFKVPPTHGVKSHDPNANDNYHQKGAINVIPGMKNVSSKSTFEWNTASKKPTSTDSPVKTAANYQVKLDRSTHSPSSFDVQSNSTAPALSYQIDVPQAGMASYTKRNLNDNPTYTWSDIRLKQYGTSAPFGLTLEEGQKREIAPPPSLNKSVATAAAVNTNPSSNVKSLADIMKAKKSEPKSLANMMTEKRQ